MIPRKNSRSCWTDILSFFNTEEAFGSIIPGVILGMEEKRAEGEEIPDELIQSNETALMGPLPVWEIP